MSWSLACYCAAVWAGVVVPFKLWRSARFWGHEDIAVSIIAITELVALGLVALGYYLA